MASSGEIEKLERRWSENQLGLTFAPLAEAYRKGGDPARALLLLQTGMSQHPNYIPAHIVRGRCHLDTQSDAEAELAFLRVTELDPENVIALKSLAEISERMGRLPEAIRRLEMLLDVDRNNEEARGHLDRLREVFASLSAAPAAEIPVMESLAEELFPDRADRPAPAFVSEFQLRNDAETLLPSEERFEDVVLAEETELEVRESEAGESAEESLLLSVGDFSSTMIYEPPPPDAPQECEETDAPAPAGEPELVVTETMAEIFLRQGHRELALAVYTQLSIREPGNDRIAAVAASLQQELSPPAPPPPPEEPAPRFAATETGGRSVHALFGGLLSASRPAVATAIHPPAFEAPRRPAGEPTRPAQDALSLSAVFGDEASPSGPAAPPAESAGEPSFDEFFAPGASAESELPKSPGTKPAAAASQVPEDLEQFNAWLRGLKR